MDSGYVEMETADEGGAKKDFMQRLKVKQRQQIKYKFRDTYIEQLEKQQEIDFRN